MNDPTRPGCAACTSERPADYKVPEPGPADTIKKPTLAAVGGKQSAAATQAAKPVAATSAQPVKTPTPLAVKPAAGGAIAKTAVVDVKAVANNGAASKVVKKVNMIFLKSELNIILKPHLGRGAYLFTVESKVDKAISTLLLGLEPSNKLCASWAGQW